MSRDSERLSQARQGDHGAGIGASHQIGWTGLVAKPIQLFGSIDADGYLQSCGALMPLVAPMPEKATA